MATENLETMISNSSPTKSEIISLSFSKSLNADYLMLSDETATSNRFLKTINWLKNFNQIKKNNQNKNDKKKFFKQSKDLLFENLDKINEKTSKILVFTRKGYVIDKILGINPSIEMIIFTDNQKIYNLSSLRANTITFKTKMFPRSLDEFIFTNIKKNKKKIFKNKNNIYLVYAAFARKHYREITLTILEERDFK